MRCFVVKRSFSGTQILPYPEVRKTQEGFWSFSFRPDLDPSDAYSTSCGSPTSTEDVEIVIIGRKFRKDTTTRSLGKFEVSLEVKEAFCKMCSVVPKLSKRYNRSTEEDTG